MTMQNQEAFDKVVRHLFTQKVKSELEDGGLYCAYRGNNGTKCAVGCLIPDDKYSFTMEMKTVLRLVDNFPGILVGYDLRLLNRLQQTHDSCKVSEWETELRSLAVQFNLTFPEDAIQKEG